MQQSVASQQPTQNQNIHASGPQPQYFIGNPQLQQYMYVPCPAYATLPTQPYSTSYTAQLYAKNDMSTPQQVCEISIVMNYSLHFVPNISQSWLSTNSQPQSQLIQLFDQLLEITISFCSS